MNGKLFMLMGTPGSGKSTFIQKHMNHGTDIWISRDAIRFSMIKENEEYFSKENEVFKKFIYEINLYLSEGKNVFADATHLNKQSRAKVLRALTVKPREVSVIWLQTPLNECIEHNELRRGTRSYVPVDQLTRMAYRLQMPTINEGINKVYIVRPNEIIQMINLMEV